MRIEETSNLPPIKLNSSNSHRMQFNQIQMQSEMMLQSFISHFMATIAPI